MSQDFKSTVPLFHAKSDAPSPVHSLGLELLHFDNTLILARLVGMPVALPVEMPV